MTRDDPDSVCEAAAGDDTSHASDADAPEAGDGADAHHAAEGDGADAPRAVEGTTRRARPGSTPDASRRPTPTRRGVLAVLGTVALAGCQFGGADPGASDNTSASSPTGSPSTLTSRPVTDSRDGSTPKTPGVFDVVEAGADPTGEKPIDPVVDRLLVDDATLRFPDGTYRLDDLRVDGLSGVELIAPEGAVLRPPDGIANDVWLYLRNCRDFRFEGFTLDNTAPGVAPAHLFNATGGDNIVKDVTVEGFREHRQHCFRPWPEGKNTTLTLENVRMPDGNLDGAAVYVPERDSYVTDRAPGALRFRDCRVENFSQGVYASGHGGPVEFVGGTYANCGIAQIRAGGGNGGAVVRDVTVRVDGPADPINEKPNMRGIWLREGEGTVIDNATVEMLDLGGSYSEAAIQIHFYQGRTTVSNTDIRLEEPIPGLLAQPPTRSFADEPVPSMDAAPGAWDLTIENTSVTGSASGGSAIVVKDRSGNVFRNLCIQQPGRDRNGIYLDGSEDNLVADSTINVSGDPLVYGSGDAELRSLSYSGSCAGGTVADRPAARPDQ